MKRWNLRKAETTLVIILTAACYLLSPSASCAQESQGSPQDTVEAILKIRRFTKLDGPARLNELEVVLPQVLKAGLFRYRWLDASFEELAVLDSRAPASLAGNASAVSKFVVEGTFVAFEDKIRLDVTVKSGLENASTTEFRGFELFGEDTILDVADRLGKRIADALQARLASGVREHRILFQMDSTFQATPGSGTTYASLGPLLSSSVFSRLSGARLNNVSFKRVDIGKMPGDGAKPDAVISGQFNISENDILATTLIHEVSGAEFRVEIKDTLDQVPRIIAGLSKGVLDIIQGRLTSDGHWRQEPISLLRARPEEYLGQARKYGQSKELNRAIVMYKKAIEMKPDYSDARSGLAELYMTQDDFESAISEYRDILQHDSKDVTALIGLASAYVKTTDYQAAIKQIELAQQIGVKEPQAQARMYKILGDAYSFDGKSEAAIAQYLHGLEASGGSAELYHALIKEFRSNDDTQRAIEYLQKARQRYPREMEFTHDLASIYNQQGIKDYTDGKYEKALEELNQALILQSGDRHLEAEAYGYRGAIVGHFQAQPDLSKGFADLKKSVELDPGQEWNRRFLGSLYQESKQYPEALQSLKQAIAIEPTPYSYVEMSFVYRLMNNFDAALDCAQQARKLRSDYPEAFSEMALIYEAKMDPDNAIASVNKYLELEPKSHWGYRELGVIYENQKKDHKRAIENLQRAVELGQTALAYDKLGEAYSNLERKEEAIKSLKRAVELDPNDRWAREFLAMVYFNKGDYDRAKETLELSVSASPSEWAYTELAKVYLKKVDYNKAAESLKRALKLNPEYPDAYTTFESLYASLKQPAALVALLEDSIKNDPKFDWAYTKLASIYRDGGDSERAIEYLEKAIAIKPNSDTYKMLADAYQDAGKWTQEREVARKLVDLEPKGADGYYYLSQGYAGSKDFEKALEAVQQGITVTGRSADLSAERAYVYFLKKDYAQAIQDCREAINLSPDYSFSYWILTKTQLAQGAYDQALVNVQKAIERGYSSFGLLAEAYKGLHRIQEVDKILRAYAEKFPDNATMLAGLAVAYHDYLYANPSGYKQAYELNRKAYELQPQSLQVRENFAEANFTAERYDRALQLAEEVLRDPSLAPDDKLSVKVIAIASLLSKSEVATAFSELGEFMRYYESISEDYERSWSFEGTKYFIGKNSILSRPEKNLLLSLIKILESPKAEGDSEFKQLKESLPSLFQQLQAAAAAP